MPSAVLTRALATPSASLPMAQPTPALSDVPWRPVVVSMKKGDLDEIEPQVLGAARSSMLSG